PNEAGVSVACVRAMMGRAPLLGVCLGHQSIGQATGGKIVRAKRLMHGKTDRIEHNNRGLFAGLPNPLTATRYHSLVIDPGTLSDDFEICAWSEAPDGSQEIMAIQHKTLPVFGWQFHPESFLTENGPELLRRFLAVEAVPS
ncbi:MAG: aminodeoxychorismate/anthranilate synthase component II, partial [Planctomycetales bacterium]|nr:aminodeoxychorismate/anthranilate synthase component II [Planctomycetales bacterium]